jgi:hypothetical protein
MSEDTESVCRLRQKPREVTPTNDTESVYDLRQKPREVTPTNDTESVYDLRQQPREASPTHLPSTIRPDYYRVVSALLVSLCIVWLLYTCYHRLNRATDTADSSMYNSSQFQGDLLVVSFHLHARNTGTVRHADVLILLDSLRSEDQQNFSFYIGPQNPS